MDYCHSIWLEKQLIILIIFVKEFLSHMICTLEEK
jgi:hypothetical protein